MINAVNRKVANAMKHSANSAPSPATQPVNTDNETFFQGNKKLIIGGVAALAVAGATAAYVVTKHRMPTEVKELLDATMKTEIDAKKLAQGVREEADELAKYTESLVEIARTKYDEVMALFRKYDTSTPNGTIFSIKVNGVVHTNVKYVNNGETYLININGLLREYTNDGKIIREAYRNPCMTRNVKNIDYIMEGVEETENGRKVKQIFDCDFSVDGGLFEYKEGYEEIGDGIVRYGEIGDSAVYIAKNISLKNGKISRYMEDWKDNGGNSMSMTKCLRWEDGGKLETYEEGYSEIGKNVKYAKALVWKNDKLSRYMEGYEKIKNISYATKALIWENDKLSIFAKRVPSDLSNFSRLEFENGIPSHYCLETATETKKLEKTKKGWVKTSS